MRRFALYLLRWQASGLILAPVIWLVDSPVWAAVIGNLIGGVIFFGIDRWIFRQTKEVRT